MTYLAETVAAAPVKKGKRWLVNIAIPGKGNTGNYSAEMLQEFGPTAYPAKTKAYFGHALPQDRDPRDQLGTYPDGAFWNAAEGKLQAELQPYKHWEPVVEALGSDLELSMFALEYEKNADGDIVKISPHRANSVDAVGYGGLHGSGVQEQLFESLVEQARAADPKPGATSASQEKEKNPIMEEKLDKLIALFESFVGAQSQNKTDEAQAKVDAEALNAASKAAVESYSAKVALVEEARESLLPSQVESLLEDAKGDSDIAPLVESAKKVYAEAQSVLAESINGGGRTLGSGAVEDWTVAGVRV